MVDSRIGFNTERYSQELSNCKIISIHISTGTTESVDCLFYPNWFRKLETNYFLIRSTSFPYQILLLRPFSPNLPFFYSARLLLTISSRSSFLSLVSLISRKSWYSVNSVQTILPCWSFGSDWSFRSCTSYFTCIGKSFCKLLIYWSYIPLIF